MKTCISAILSAVPIAATNFLPGLAVDAHRIWLAQTPNAEASSTALYHSEGSSATAKSVRSVTAQFMGENDVHHF